MRTHEPSLHTRLLAPSVTMEQVYALECHANTWQNNYCVYAFFHWLFVANEVLCSFHNHTHAFTSAKRSIIDSRYIADANNIGHTVYLIVIVHNRKHVFSNSRASP